MEAQDRPPPHPLRRATRGGVARAGALLRVAFAAVRLGLVSALALLGAILALAPLVVRLRPSGRRAVRRPAPRAAASLARPLPGLLGRGREPLRG